MGGFNFHKSVDIDTIMNESLCIDRKAHLLWIIPYIDDKFAHIVKDLCYKKIENATGFDGR